MAIPKLFWLFIFTMFIPSSVGVRLGSLRLSSYRIVLIIFLLSSLPFIFKQLKYRLNNPSFFLFVFCIWAALAMVVNHGIGPSIETSGIFAIETLCPYFIVLAFCSSFKRLQSLVFVYIAILCLSLLITVPENITGKNWFSMIFDLVFPIESVSLEKRLGLHRASGTFDHPILQGVVASTAVGLAWFVCTIPRFMLVCLAALTSVSSGAIVTMNIQFMLIAWERLTRKVKKRWLILSVIMIIGYFAIEIISSRSAMRAIISNITLSPHTAYNRIYIWTYGINSNVNQNPFFGIGLHEWVRPSYMSSSVDAFWLVNMLRYGYVGFLLYASAILMIIVRLFKLRLRNPHLKSLRRGWLVGMVGLSVAACTVHFWNNAYVFFNFYLGIGAAMFHLLKKEDKRIALRNQAEATQSQPGLTSEADSRRRQWYIPKH